MCWPTVQPSYPPNLDNHDTLLIRKSESKVNYYPGSARRQFALTNLNTRLAHDTCSCTYPCGMIYKYSSWLTFKTFPGCRKKNTAKLRQQTTWDKTEILAEIFSLAEHFTNSLLGEHIANSQTAEHIANSQTVEIITNSQMAKHIANSQTINSLHTDQQTPTNRQADRRTHIEQLKNAK